MFINKARDTVFSQPGNPKLVLAYNLKKSIIFESLIKLYQKAVS